MSALSDGATPHSPGKVVTVGAKIKVSCSTNQQVSEIIPPNLLVSEITPPNQQVAEITPPNPLVSEIAPPNHQVSEVTPPLTPQKSGAEPTQYYVLGLPIVHLSGYT